MKIAVIVVFLIFASSLLNDALKFASFQKSLSEAETELKKLEAENQSLEVEKRYLTSEGYKEIQIRNKLGLARENEIVVVLPSEEILRKLSPRSSQVEIEELPRKNWQEWSELFLGELI